MDSQARALRAARAALEKQAEDVVVLDLRGLSTVADFFVIGTAHSVRQLAALNEHIEAELARAACPIWHTEGAAAPEPASGGGQQIQWLLMDCGEIVVHLFDQRARAFYRLEALWADAPRLPVEPVTPHPT